MNIKETIGKKIKERRREIGLTQTELCGSIITRNMLSLIESGKAMPSVDVIIKLSDALGVPASYLLSQSNSLFFYEKDQKIGYIRELYRSGKYSYCMTVIDSLSEKDDELSYIYAEAAFMYGKSLLDSGALLSARTFLHTALDYSSKTVYNTKNIEVTAPLYLAVCDNIQSPMLEFDSSKYLHEIKNSYDIEFYKYIIPDLTFKYTYMLFQRHIDAKNYMKNHSYKEAIDLLLSIEDMRSEQYNATVLFGAYTDLEICYKQLGDFENAYRYSTKRISLLNAFKS